MDVCVICNDVIENDGTELRLKGSDKINNVSLTFGDTVKANIGDKVHEKCRRMYVSENHSKTRSNQTQETNNNDFNFETCCLFCEKFDKKKDLNDVEVSKEFLQSIKNATRKRNNDEWTQEVSNRMFSSSFDLIGVKAVFHTNCRIGYRTNKPKPNSNKPQHKTEYKKGFYDIINLIKSNEQQQYSIHELIDEMNNFSDGNAYSFNQMKTNLQKHFGDELIISSVKNKKTLVTLRTKCYDILNEFYEHSRNRNEKQRAIQKAGDIIITEIKKLPPNKDFYPSPSDLSIVEAEKFMPESLKSILNQLINGNGALLKIVAIGQAIIQTNHRENVMSPLQIALAAQMFHYTGSRFVVSTLNELGFGSTYGEVRKFQLSAAIDLHQKRLNTSNEELQVIKYVGDNVDHNVRTLDGKNTFHGMGIISIHAPLKKTCAKIPRIKSKLQDVKALGVVDIIPYFEKMTPTTTLFYRKLNKSEIQDPNSHLDLLWKMSWKENTDRPMWSGMMEMVQKGSYPEKPTINFLPIIDMNPNDLTCINSTLHFICKDAEKFNAHPTVTFDQPLWIKARTIVENEPESSPIKRLVVCLGGFHLKMSYLGSIGHIMSGSGLDVALAQTYAENSVIDMLTGKAYARAIRGYFMVDSALNSIIFDEILSDEQMPQQVDDLLRRVIDKSQDIDELKNHELIKKISKSFSEKKESLKKDPTSRLWLQYMKMIDALKSNIRGDRTGNFKLHLETLEQMLPFFPASGHNSYTKSVHIYLQDMKRLEMDNPTVFLYFSDGNFITRRTDRYWAGLPDDLIIEQVLMRSLKTSGGPTRGRGMDDAKLSLWLLSLPARAEINNAIQDLTNLKTETSEQHKECGKSRSIRDNKDITCIYNFLKERNPFAGTTPNSLRNIADGVISSSKSNVDQAEEIGLKILKSLEDKNVFEYSFEKCKQVVKMSCKNEILIGGDVVHIDPETLFQRLLMLILQSNYTEEEKEDVFTYELSHKAPSLFDADGFIREASSSTFVKALVTRIVGILDKSFEIEKLSDVVYLLEGDWNIDKINWKIGESFNEICNRYVEFLKEKFENAAIVFECGSCLSTNDEPWLRETKGVLGMEVIFTSDMILKIKKETFLQNRKNKQRFIELLGKELDDNGFTVRITFDNAVVAVATLAADLSESNEIVVVGKKVDLIMVLCYYAVEDNYSIFYMYEETSKKPPQVFKITEMKNRLGSIKSKHRLFVHAMGGCRTTSQLHNTSKISLFSKLDQDRFIQLAEVFCCPDSPEESIIKAGMEVIKSLYNGKANETMKKLRYRKFVEKSRQCTTAIQCKMLPPTEAAAKFHILRVYHQVQAWLQNKLNPFNFGWVERNSLLRPVTTHFPVAPPNILEKIRCGCKTDCDSARCTCFKYGFKCTTACKVCAGCSCSNGAPIETTDIDNDLDEDD